MVFFAIPVLVAELDNVVPLVASITLAKGASGSQAASTPTAPHNTLMRTQRRLPARGNEA
jgi:hypothetical protein